MKDLKNKFRKIKKLPTWLFFFPYITLMGMSKLLYRRVYVDPNDIIKNNGGMVSVTWHNRLMFFPALFPKAARKKTIAVISASRDGQYVADLVSFFGIQAVRGSSKKGGASALFGALANLKNGFNISFTPDGPRGPKYTMSKGPIILASQLQAPIVPLSINASRYWQIKSWDNFQIPKPFAKLTIVVGDPITVPASLTHDDIKKYQEIVRQALLKITKD